MMRMVNPLFVTGKAVLMDSGFYVLKGIVGMLRLSGRGYDNSLGVCRPTPSLE